MGLGEAEQAKRDAVKSYLSEEFPQTSVIYRPDLGDGIVTIFCVIENYGQRQLEISRPLMDDRQNVVDVLRAHSVAEKMRENPGRRVVVSAPGGGVIECDVENLR